MIIQGADTNRAGILRNADIVFADFFEHGELSRQAKELRHWRDQILSARPLAKAKRGPRAILMTYDLHLSLLETCRELVSAESGETDAGAFKDIRKIFKKHTPGNLKTMLRHWLEQAMTEPYAREEVNAAEFTRFYESLLGLQAAAWTIYHHRPMIAASGAGC